MSLIQHSLTLSWSRNGEQISQTVVIEADGETNRNITVPANQTDLAVNLDVDVSAMKSLYIHSDKALTIQTNDGTTPDDTITVAANSPVIWYTGCGWDSPLSADVTGTIYVTNTDAALLKIRILTDSTP